MEMAPPEIEARRRFKALYYWLAIPMVLVGAFILFYFNPAENGFYPRCYLKASTGLDCPGCGALRASHQLLHGNVSTAFSLNPMLVVLLPFAVVLLFNQLVRSVRGRPLFHLKLPAYLIWVLLGVVIIFTVLRNIGPARFS